MIVDAGDRKLTGHDERVWSWVGHLDTTLFSEHGRATWNDVWQMLTDHEGDFRVQACKTVANRSFLLVCQHCFAGCKGRYGKNQSAEVHQEARQALSKFLLDTDAGEDGAV